MRPGNPAVVHHAGIFTRELPPGTRLGQDRVRAGGQLIPMPVPINPYEDPAVKLARREAARVFVEDAQLIFYRPGGGFNRFPEGTAKLVYAERPSSSRCTTRSRAARRPTAPPPPSGSPGSGRGAG